MLLFFFLNTQVITVADMCVSCGLGNVCYHEISINLLKCKKQKDTHTVFPLLTLKLRLEVNESSCFKNETEI